jgi:Mlc titration factor MtfA (ptsG expression regulator)
MQWLRQLLQRHKPQIPEPLWRDCVARLPFVQRLTPEERTRLKKLSEGVLAAKSMTGAGGLELSDEIAVLIAMQAALLVLNLSLDLYDDMPGVVVYPSAFIVPQKMTDPVGVVHEWREPLAGEAVQGGGMVILSWEDVEQGHAGFSGRNVVIHEFAHKIDMLRGHPNGCPPFLAAHHQGMDPQRWQTAFSAAYDDFVRRVDALDHRLPPDFDDDNPDHAAHYDALFERLPMDPYGATNPAEFFAVASEVFFVQPGPLASDYPEIYRLLSQYYRQDPLPFA